MRLRAGLLVGFAAGVYVTAKAKQRSRQLNQPTNTNLRRSRRSNAIDLAAEKALAAVDLGVERAKDVIVSKLGDQGLIRPIIQAPSRLAASQRNSTNGANGRPDH